MESEKQGALFFKGVTCGTICSCELDFELPAKSTSGSQYQLHVVIAVILKVQNVLMEMKILPQVTIEPQVIGTRS